MRNALFIGLLFTLALVVACGEQVQQAEPVELEAPIDTAPVSNTSSIQDPCVNITCGKGQVCNKGQCGCPSGKKQCGDSCISSGSCCATKDCDQNENCVSGTCVFTCDNVRCPSNKICEEGFKGCTCPANYNFCDVQNKCIPTGNCCSAFDCGRGSESRCAATVTSVRICLLGSEKACKFFDEGRAKPLDVDDKVIDVSVGRFNYTQSALLLIGDNNYTLDSGQKQSIGDKLAVQMEQIKETGGGCTTRNVATFDGEEDNTTN